MWDQERQLFLSNVYAIVCHIPILTHMLEKLLWSALYVRAGHKPTNIFYFFTEFDSVLYFFIYLCVLRTKLKTLTIYKKSIKTWNYEKKSNSGFDLSSIEANSFDGWDWRDMIEKGENNNSHHLISLTKGRNGKSNTFLFNAKS